MDNDNEVDAVNLVEFLNELNDKLKKLEKRINDIENIVRHR